MGTCHGDLSETFLQLILEKEAEDLSKTTSRYLALALALLYLGKQEAAMATTEALKAVPQPFSSFASTLLEICAYAGGCGLVFGGCGLVSGGCGLVSGGRGLVSGGRGLLLA